MRAASGLRLLLVSALTVVLCIAVACENKTCTCEVEDDYYTRSSPDELLSAYAHALVSKNLAACDECLHEKYIFEFTSDIAETLGLPPDAPWWGKTEDMSATQNMFNASNVTSIEMTFIRITDWLRCLEVRPGSPPDTLAALQADLDPDIKVTVETGEDPTTYWVNDSRFNVAVTVDPAETDLWVILRITEAKKNPRAGRIRAVGTATEGSTFGGIKSMFWEDR